MEQEKLIADALDVSSRLCVCLSVCLSVSVTIVVVV